MGRRLVILNYYEREFWGRPTTGVELSVGSEIFGKATVADL